jgi:ribosomal protein S12 methylthiotransferase accessory factor
VIELPRRASKACGSRDRCIPLAQTEAAIPRLRSRFGITRVGETTRLDRMAVPTYCAIVPNSPDVIGVYNGKGSTREAARVGAVMEAVERQAATNPVVQCRQRSMRDVLRVVDLTPLQLVDGADTREVPCALGVDLLNGHPAWVPMPLVAFPWRGARVTRRTSTNGLASGNNFVEAVYHALAEMIERHVWSLYTVRCEIVPRYYRGSAAADRALARELTFPTGDDTLDSLYHEVVSHGLRARVCVLEEPPFAPVALASLVEPDSHPPMAHIGLGYSLSPVHAVERALTEAVQSRVVDVQAAREDIRYADDARGSVHGKRIAALPARRWFVDLPAPAVTLRELPDLQSADLAADVRVLIAQMRAGRIRAAVAVEIARAEEFSVVRICAPDFETTAVDGRIGPIALAQLNPLGGKGGQA